MKWEQVELGDTATFVNGFPFRPTDWSTTGKEIIRIQNLTKSNGLEANRYDGTIHERYLVKKGDLLISWSGTLGIYEWNGDEAWLNQHIFKVVFDKAEVNKKYFKFLIQSKLHELEQQVHGATMKHITKGKFDALQVPLPPLRIQEQIADTLDKADALRRKDQELLQKYDELAQAFFYDMFGDPVRNEKGWEVKTLNEVCNKVTDGTHDTPERLTSGVPFITGKHIKPGFIDYLNCDFVDEQTHAEIYRRCNPEKGDVLYTNIGVNFGTAALNSVDYEFSMKNVALLKPDANIIVGEYLQFLLNDNRFKSRILSELGVGGAQQFLSLKQIRGLKVLVPDLDLQERFSLLITNLANVRSRVDTLKTVELFKNISSINFS
jgi:type I restriction enzyme S subunit